MNAFSTFAAGLGAFGTNVAVVRNAPPGEYTHPPYDGISVYMANSRLQGMVDLGEGFFEMSPQRLDFCVGIAGASGTMKSARGGHGVQVIVPQTALNAMAEEDTTFTSDFGFLHSGFQRYSPIAARMQRFSCFVSAADKPDPLRVDIELMELIESLYAFSGTQKRRLTEAAKLAPCELTLAIDMMEEGISESISVDEFARALGMTRGGFIKAFRNTTNSTPYQYLLRLRLERARMQLMESDLSIAEIAYACGFSSQQHLTNMFRQKFGIYPGKFRRQVKD